LGCKGPHPRGVGQKEKSVIKWEGMRVTFFWGETETSHPPH